MSIALWILGITSFLLVSLLILLGIESRKGQRVFLSGVRSWLDAKVTRLSYHTSHFKMRFGAGSLRILFHFITHRLLGFLLKILQFFESLLTKLQRRNRAIAKSVREEQEKNHLDLIAEHKESTALTAAEKQDLKDRSIGD